MGTGRMPLQEHGAEAPRKQPVAQPRPRSSRLAAYVASLGAGPAIPSRRRDWQKADAAFGGALFRTNCAQCHNFAGSGGALTYGKYAPTPDRGHADADLRGDGDRPGEHAGVRRQDDHARPEARDHQLRQDVQDEANPGGAGLGRIGPVSETLVGMLVGIGLLVLATLWLGTRA